MNAKQRKAAKKADQIAKEATTLLAQSKEAELKKNSTAPAAEVKKKKKKVIAAPVDEKELNSKNATETVKAITDRKDLKYRYPKDCITLDARKKFRAEVRRKVKAFEKQIKALLASELKEDAVLLDKKETEYQAYAKKVYAKKELEIA